MNVIHTKQSVYVCFSGDRFYISLLDMFGFECYQKNGMEQLFVNTLNEQLQYLFNQRIFVWEMVSTYDKQLQNLNNTKVLYFMAVLYIVT